MALIQGSPPGSNGIAHSPYALMAPTIAEGVDRGRETQHR